MADQTKLNNVTLINNTSSTQMFHDFLGMKPAAAAAAASADSPVVLAPKNPDASPSASISAGASSGGGGAAARGPISTTSDIASERQAGNHLEGIPFYGPRSDISGAEISNRLAGSKRSNSDSAFTGSTREGIPQIGHDSLESLHMMKMLKSGGGAERPRRSNDDDVFYGMQSMRPTSASLILQSSIGGSRFDATVSKWDRSIPMGAALPYPPRVGQFVPFAHQVPSNKFRDMNAGPSLISQSAADEGSRTGIKGPGILSSINAGSGTSEKNASGALPSGSKPKSGIHISEPESSAPNRQGLASASRQMTIFYGGQAHVFDDVHPNKADVIMALAGSNGGSWSTTYSSSKPGGRPPGGENYMSSGEKEAANAAAAFQRGRLLGSGNNTNQGIGSGVHHGSIVIGEEKRKQIQTGETSGEDKRKDR